MSKPRSNEVDLNERKSILGNIRSAKPIKIWKINTEVIFRQEVSNICQDLFRKEILLCVSRISTRIYKRISEAKNLESLKEIWTGFNFQMKLDKAVRKSKLLALLIPLSHQDYKEDASLRADINFFNSAIVTKFKEKEHKCLQEEAHNNRNVALLWSLPIFTAPFALPAAFWFEYHRRDYQDKMNGFKETIKELGKLSFLFPKSSSFPLENPGPTNPQWFDHL